MKAGGISSMSAASDRCWCLPLLALFMRESAHFIAARSAASGRVFWAKRASSIAQALWKEGRAGTTIALWISYLGTLIVLYFLINWLPSLVLSRGLTRVQSGVVQMMFNIGGGIGAIVIASLMDRIGRRRTVTGMYLGIAAALAALVAANGGASMACGGLLAGLFLVGGQSVLYALASSIYPDASARHRRGRRSGSGTHGLDSRAVDRGAVAGDRAKRVRAAEREHSVDRGRGDRGVARGRQVSDSLIRGGRAAIPRTDKPRGLARRWRPRSLNSLKVKECNMSSQCIGHHRSVDQPIRSYHRRWARSAAALQRRRAGR